MNRPTSNQIQTQEYSGAGSHSTLNGTSHHVSGNDMTLLANQTTTSVVAPPISSKEMCKYGSSCYRTSPEHLEKYTHPSSTKKSCEYGPGCYRTSPEHLAKYTHPIDRVLKCKRCGGLHKHALHQNNGLETPRWICMGCR